MREVVTKVFKFEELSESAKERAIEQIRNQYYKHNDFAEWAIDDCGLFEPPHSEMVETIGEDYNFPLIENGRGKISFSTDRDWHLQCHEAMNITNEYHFLLWLGIHPEHHDDVTFNIYTPTYRNSDTKISFEYYGEDLDENDEPSQSILDQFYDAEIKFNAHIQSILRRIEEDIDYRYSDEAIIEDSFNYEFTEDGSIF